MRRFFLILAAVLISASSVFAQNNGEPHFPVRVKIDNLEFKFMDVTGFSEDAPLVINQRVRKKYGNVVLKYGIASNTKEMNDFLTRIKKGTIKKTTTTIEIIDEQGNVSGTWFIANAIPVKAITTTNGRDISIDTMELAHTGVTSKNGNKK